MPNMTYSQHVVLRLRRSASSTTRRLTNQWNGKLTQSFVWLRQASSLRQFPLISDLRRRREVLYGDSISKPIKMTRLEIDQCASFVP